MDVLWGELDCEASAVIKRLSYWRSFVCLFFYMSLSERHIVGSGENLKVPSFILATQMTLSPGLTFYPFCHQNFSISTRDLVDLRNYLNCETLRIGPWTWFLPSEHKKWGTPSRFLLNLLNIHARYFGVLIACFPHIHTLELSEGARWLHEFYNHYFCYSNWVLHSLEFPMPYFVYMLHHILASVIIWVIVTSLHVMYSCLENFMDRGARQDTVHEVTKSWTWLSTHANTHTHTHTHTHNVSACHVLPMSISPQHSSRMWEIHAQNLKFCFPRPPWVLIIVPIKILAGNRWYKLEKRFIRRLFAQV